MRIWRPGSEIMYLLSAVLYIFVLVVLPQSGGHAAAPVSGDYERLITQAETIPILIEDKVISKYQIPDPHWRKNGCLACHVDEPEAGNSVLKAPSDGTCFYCHQEEDHVNIHPVKITPNKKMLESMPKEFSLNLAADGTTNCLSCHDAVLTGSREVTSMRLNNRSFLRGGPYETPVGICYQCHNRDAYQKLNPHDQIDDQGVLNEKLCLFCHQDIPKQEPNKKATQVTMQPYANWGEICQNCHRSVPHPNGNTEIFSSGVPPDHLVVPEGKIRKRLAKMTKKNDLGMPLDPVNGKIYCATCHNPHERGVIKKPALAKGADAKQRLRSKDNCLYCHDV